MGESSSFVEAGPEASGHCLVWWVVGTSTWATGLEKMGNGLCETTTIILLLTIILLFLVFLFTINYVVEMKF